ncbi:glutamate--tRNA ligase family protein [Algoriphagus namhaensis]|uniref:Glutamate--tRNA ligase family protein n=1 Tax=Algoriphagus namhaensis TaxID=915353 RepID=A0ABV8AWU1_9BACT
MKSTLTRIAPTPSGFLHLGNAFSFLLTKAIAMQNQSKILLRIDDLDRDRFRMEYLQDIFDTLDFLEISYDLGPKSPEDFLVNWTQLNRLDLYKNALERLWESKSLFACTCSRRKISQLNSSGHYLGHCLDRNIPKTRKDTAWRINTSEADLISKLDLNSKRNEFILPEDVAFFVVRKKDELPAYQLTSLVDDIHFGIDLIVRGKDLHSSSLAQLFLAKELGESSFEKTLFHHHPLLKSPNGQKLSKSDGATSIQFLRKSGKSLSDIFLILSKALNWEVPVNNFEDFQSKILKK